MAKDTDTEKRILHAARTVFIRHGTSGARMQEIAEEAGVNQALLHYYFRSKERLSEAVFSEAATRMFPMVIQILGSDEPIEKKVEGIVATYIDNMSRSPFLPGYLISELHHHPERIHQLIKGVAGVELSTALKPVLEKLDKQIAAEVRAGRMRRISAQQFMANLISLSVFPFAARPMLCAAFGFDDDGFSKFIATRRKELPQFIMSALTL
jgi:AcrR family transcriptional regulator